MQSILFRKRNHRSQATMDSSSVASVAARIQDRAQKYAQEQQELAKARKKHAIALKSVQTARTQAAAHRRVHLQSLLEVTELELEASKLKENIKDCHQETKVLQESTATPSPCPSSTLVNLLASHAVRQQVYLRSVRHSLNMQRQAQERRALRLEFLQRRPSYMAEISQVQADILRHRDWAASKMQRIQELADSVKQALQQVRVPCIVSIVLLTSSCSAPASASNSPKPKPCMRPPMTNSIVWKRNCTDPNETFFGWWNLLGGVVEVVVGWCNLLFVIDDSLLVCI